MGTVHKFTLDEYKDFKRGLKEVNALTDDVQSYKCEITQPYYQPVYFDDLETWKTLLKKLEGDWAEWQGEDADAYRETAMDIINDIQDFHKEFVDKMDRMLDGMQHQREGLEELIRRCENGEMTLGGNIVIQGADLLGIEVE